MTYPPYYTDEQFGALARECDTPRDYCRRLAQLAYQIRSMQATDPTHADNLKELALQVEVEEAFVWDEWRDILNYRWNER